jgi:hypothetical protein
MVLLSTHRNLKSEMWYVGQACTSTAKASVPYSAIHTTKNLINFYAYADLDHIITLFGVAVEGKSTQKAH